VAERYFTVDLRTLALFRVAFGLFLLGNLYFRTSGHEAIAFLTDDGVLPAHVVAHARHDRFSLLFAVTRLAELRVAAALIGLVYVAYTLGWHTRLMQVLAAVALLSLDERNSMLENGGYWIAHIAAVGTAFLPLGDRFSLDALRVTRPAQTAITRLAYGLLILDLCAIYLFNAAQKTGSAWKDGTAVHLVLWHARVANPLAGWLRMHEPSWFSPVMTTGTLLMEVTIFLLIASPVFQSTARRTAILLIALLHVGISLLMTLGPFCWVMILFSLLLVGPEDWDDVERHVPARLRGALARTAVWLEAVFGPRVSPPELAPEGETLRRMMGWLRNGTLLVLAVGWLGSLLYENRVPDPFHFAKRPKWAGMVSDYLNSPQQWHMFAPDAPRDNGYVIVDGELANHEHVDPLTGLPPDFEPMLHTPVEIGERWRDYLYRLGGQEKYTHFLPYFRDYLLRLHTLPGANIHEPLIHVDVYWVTYTAPPRRGKPPTHVRKKLLISGSPEAPAVPAAAPSPSAAQPETEPASPETPAPSQSQSQSQAPPPSTAAPQ
jgi:hypothetical protein